MKTVVIGEGQLASNCISRLQEAGFQISHIVSQCHTVQTNAQQHGIKVLKDLSQLESVMTETVFDYLFSIIYLEKIPASILSKIKVDAINYHDGKLPDYSGLNTPSWAIINGVRDYGITWHRMTADIDAGEILVDKPITISDDDSSLSLNIKCATAAQEGFIELLDSLKKGNTSGRPQHGQRQLFLRSRRPEDLGFIYPEQSISSVSRLIQGLDYGPYPNPLCLSKVRLGDKVLFIKKANTLVETTAEVGQLLSLSPFKIQLKDGTLQIDDIYGEESPEQIAVKLGLKTGDRLNELMAPFSQSIQDQLRNSAKSEFFYNQSRIAAPAPVSKTSDDWQSGEPELIGSIPADGNQGTIVAKACMFLSRYCQSTALNVPIYSEQVGPGSLFPKSWIFPLSADWSDSISATAETLKKSWNRFQKFPTPSLDYFHRYPEAETEGDATFAISIGAPLAHTPFQLVLKPDELCLYGMPRKSDSDTTWETQGKFVFSALKRFFTSSEKLSLGEASLISGEDFQSMFPVDQREVSKLSLYQQFLNQVQTSPDSEALVYQGETLSYAQLSTRVDKLALLLKNNKVSKGDLVGLHMERSLDGVALIFAILKTGAAWVPLDPDFPKERLKYIAGDAELNCIVTTREHNQFPDNDQRLLFLDEQDWQNNEGQIEAASTGPHDRAYIIYTSGSTGQPKGVVLEHGHASNFFQGMDQRIDTEGRAKVWLALTTLSFDISILELVWTLTRGFKVVIGHQTLEALSSTGPEKAVTQEEGPEFSLFYFGGSSGASEEADNTSHQEKYRLLLEGAKFADKNGFHGVWTPERHFGAFGGHYPNPAVTGAAIAAITNRIHVRAGSCVAALHSPYRIAEEWSVVDNLTGGRCGIAVAAGWQPNDFIIKPENWADRKQKMFSSAELVQKLWQGEKVETEAPTGAKITVETYPRPISKRLPIWVTTAGNPETFQEAGRQGYRILTHLLGQDINELKTKIALYREAYKEAGHPEGGDWVTLMLHTFIGEDEAEVKETARGPMKAYLKTAMALVKAAAWSFPTFQNQKLSGESMDEVLERGLDKETEDALLDHAFERYYNGSSLIGTKESLAGTIAAIKELRVNELGCLMDFGIPTDTVLESLPSLKRLMQHSQNHKSQKPDENLLDLVTEHNVQFMQSTPTFAQMLLHTETGKSVLEKVPTYLLGGEALPDKLAGEILELSGSQIMNMYGPTETTIWSTNALITPEKKKVHLGTPITNTWLYIVDEHMNLVAPEQAGELLIGGASVAREYLNRPELTAERFIPNPFENNDAPRLYRTGDLVRYDINGKLEYIGRNDFQVKIRGHRLETQEVEAKIDSIQGVSLSVVVAVKQSADYRLVAFILAEAGISLSMEKVKAELLKLLPDYAVPSEIIQLESFPRTPNNKIDRKALIAQKQELVKTQPKNSELETQKMDRTTKTSSPSKQKQEEKVPSRDNGTKTPATKPKKSIAFAGGAPVDLADQIRKAITPLWMNALGLETIPQDSNFFDLGGHSLLAVALHQKMREKLDVSFSLIDFLGNPSLKGISQYLAKQNPELVVQTSDNIQESEDKENDNDEQIAEEVTQEALLENEVSKEDAATKTVEIQTQEDIAVVGMAARLPGSDSIEEYWRNIEQGIDCTEPLSIRELRKAGVPDELLDDPNYVKRGAFLNNPEYFDASFFGLSPKEASLMDPQHRQFLEVCYHALENSGTDPFVFEGKIGVFGSSSIHKYMMEHLNPNEEVMDQNGFFLVRHTGNDKDFLTTRLSYTLGLTGPSMAVQTACSSSLVAVHMACKSLLQGESDMTVVGGTSLELPLRTGYLYQKGSVASPDGHCRAFSDDSQGTFFGSGTGAIVLKPLSKAISDKDQIFCVIKGSAVSNDGQRKAGYMAPSSDGQAQAVQDAIADAGIPSNTLGYLEAHGTGTPLGDPIEVAGLTSAFEDQKEAGIKLEQSCALGTVKPNIGHLDTAAGIASFIKAALVVKEGVIPPIANFSKPSSHINWQTSPFYLPAEKQAWRIPGLRRAGVNSTGVGGTNAHVIIEQSPVTNSDVDMAKAEKVPMETLFLSAKSAGSLQKMAENTAQWLSLKSNNAITDICANFGWYKPRFNHGLAVRGQNREELIAALKEFKDHPGARSKESSHTDALPVVFMFPGGGSQYGNMGRGLYETFPLYRDLMDQMLDQALEETGRDFRPILLPSPEQVKDAHDTMKREPACAMVATVLVETALARLLISLGVQPWAMTGHSLGEYAAALLAEVMTIPEAVRLLWARGTLSQKVPAGGMVSINLSPADLKPFLQGSLEISVENTPTLSVVSGPLNELESFKANFKDQEDIVLREIPIDIPAHSAQLEPVVAEFRAVCEGVTFQVPQIPFICNGTGTWVTEDVTNPEYWVRHFREPVKFAMGIEELAAKEEALFLEVGPGTALSSLLRNHESIGEQHQTSHTLPHPKDKGQDLDIFYKSIGDLWLSGCRFDLEALYRRKRPQKQTLPAYPFDQKPYFIEKPSKEKASSNKVTSKQSSRSKNPTRGWFYQETLISGNKDDLVVSELKENNWLVFGSKSFQRDQFIENLEASKSKYCLVEPGQGFKVINAKQVTAEFSEESLEKLIKWLGEQDFQVNRLTHFNTLGTSSLSAIMESGIHGLLNFIRTFTTEFPSDELTVEVVTDRYASAQDSVPEKKLLSTVANVLPKEFNGLSCGIIDIGNGHYKPLSQNFWKTREFIVLEGEGFKEQFHQQKEPETESNSIPVRDGGTYLITGGLGGIGLTLARSLVEKHNARIALFTRQSVDQGFAPFIANRQDQDRKNLEFLETKGTDQVQLIQGDVANLGSIQEGVKKIRSSWGALHGVIHGAGVLNDGPALFKTSEIIERTLAPKVRGTLNLERALWDESPDFFIVFSSSSVATSPAGQYDYVAANAFLKAFAESRNLAPLSKHQEQTRFLSIGWGMWQSTGMAFQNFRFRGQAAEPKSLRHPMLQKQLIASDDLALYESEFDRDSHWFINEHRIKDSYALLPGTGFIEMARAAVHEFLQDPKAMIELSDVFFLAPLVIPGGQSVRVQIEVRKIAESLDVKIVRLHQSGAHETLTTLKASAFKAQAPERAKIHSLVKQLTSKSWTPEPHKQFSQEQHLDFGQRWQGVKRVSQGKDHVFAQLALGESFHSDLNQFGIHPALMDLGTSLPLELFKNYKSEYLFVPVNYRRLLYYAPFEGKVWSHGFAVSGNTESGTYTVNISYYNEAGQLLMVVDGLTLKKIEDMGEFKASLGTLSEPDQMIASAIKPEDGVEAFYRALSTDKKQSHWYVSSIDLIDAMTPLEIQQGSIASEDSGADMELRNPIEEKVAKLFKDTLGVDKPSPIASFFDLGGHSLIAIRLLAGIRKEFNLEYELSLLFKAPSIRALAASIQQNLPDDQSALENEGPEDNCEKAVEQSKEWSSLVEISQGSGEQKFFCIHGAGGNVLNFYPLSKTIGEDISFYGLQAKGIDGKLPLATSVTEMASSYVAEILEVQSQGPYLLGGYSGGGLVAIEVARMLKDMGHTVKKVVMIDTICPEGSTPKIERRPIRKVIAEEGLGYVLRYPQIRKERWEAEKRKKVYESYKNKGLRAPEEVREDELFWEFTNAASAHNLEYYAGDVLLFKASEASQEFKAKGQDLGWSPWVKNIEVCTVPGDHGSLMMEPGITIAGSIIRTMANQQSTSLH